MGRFFLDIDGKQKSYETIVCYDSETIYFSKASFANSVSKISVIWNYSPTLRIDMWLIIMILSLQ